MISIDFLFPCGFSVYLVTGNREVGLNNIFGLAHF